MKTITINGTEYTLRYSMRAMLEKDCADAVSRYAMNFASIDSPETFAKAYSEVIGIVLIALHAGLLEKHNLSMEECTDLLDAYFDEHEDDGKGDAMSLMNELMEVMRDDGFFRKTGLEKILSFSQENPDEMAHQNRQQRRRAKKMPTATAEPSEK